MEWSNSSILALLLPIILVFITTALIVMRRRRHKSKLLPPGPHGLPIIGHLHLLGRLPHRSLYELSKVHGPLMWLQLGSVPAVVASSPEMAKQILQKHDHTFAGRMPTAAAIHLFGEMDIAFSQPNAHWKLMRRLCMTELFSTNRLGFFKAMRKEEVCRLMRSVLADRIHGKKIRYETHHCATPQCVRQRVLETTNNIITQMVFGKRLSELQGDQQACRDKSSIVELLVQVPELAAMFNVGDFLPFVAWMDLQGCVRRSKQVAAGLKVALQEIIQERHLSYRNKGQLQQKDLLDLLLQTSMHTPIDIMDVLVDLLVAGTDTTSSTIEWALAELLMNPEKMRAVQAELDEAVGKERLVKEEDMAHLPYLVACVKESMRLHPVVPLLVPHKTSQACEVLGYNIPANTLTYVNVWAIGRDSKVWESPIQFLPERFLGETTSAVDAQGQHFELLPFGSGRRICPGLRLALLSVHLILASLLQGFEWSLPHSPKLDMSAEVFGFSTSLATPLLAFATPRLPTELY